MHKLAELCVKRPVFATMLMVVGVFSLAIPVAHALLRAASALMPTPGCPFYEGSRHA
jgi:hypothetical protein